MKVDPEDHDISVGYTNEDDGIWLWCTCGWQDHVGDLADHNTYRPSVGLVLTAASKHWDEVSR